MEDETTLQSNPHRILLVAHGSRSAEWNARMQEFATQVEEHLVSSSESESSEVYKGLCFLEKSKPSLNERVTHLIQDNPKVKFSIIPFFLARGGHVAEDIPEVLETIEGLSDENWDLVETPEWPRVLAGNTERRLKNLSMTPSDQLVVCGYGSSSGDEEWCALISEIWQETALSNTHDNPVFVPCGHFLEDYGEPLRCRLSSLQTRGVKRVIILPFFLSMASYQTSLIPGVIREFPELDIVYKETAILPDPVFSEWAVKKITDQIIEHEKSTSIDILRKT